VNNIKDIDKKIEFLKKALVGGGILRNHYQRNGETDNLQKTMEDDNKIIKEIKDLKNRKIMIMRSNKINKILNG